MNPLASLLVQLGLGRAIGPYDVVSNWQTGSGIPATMGVGTASPGQSFSPNVLTAPAQPLSGPTPTMSDPTGMATGAGSGASGLGANPFLMGALFNALFPSGAPTASPSTGIGTAGSNLAPSQSGTSALFDMAAGQPTSGGLPGGGGGETGASVSPGPSGSAVGPAPTSAISSVDYSGLSPALQGAQLGLLGQGLNYAGFNPTVTFGPNGPNFSMTNDGNFGLSLSGLLGTLGQLALGPAFSLGNALSGGILGGLAGAPTRGGDPGSVNSFASLFGGSTNLSTPGIDYSGAGRSLSDAARSAEMGQPSPPSESAAPTVDTELETEAGPAVSATPASPTPQGNVSAGPGAGGQGLTGVEGMPGAVGQGAGAAGDSGDKLLCNYSLDHGNYDQATAKNYRRVFGASAQRAQRENPGIADSIGHYHQASRQLIRKLDTLDPTRRKAAHQDLRQNLVEPFHAAAKAGDWKGAGKVLRSQVLRLAKEHGVPIPPAHLAAAEKILGPVERTTAETRTSGDRSSSRSAAEGMRRGGLVTAGDPHSKTDDVPAELQRGEAVIPREWVGPLRHLLGYAARHAIGPKADAAEIATFLEPASVSQHLQHGGLAGTPQAGIGSQITARIEGLDPARRAAVHADLNRHLLGPVAAAVKAGQIRQALPAILAHVARLATQHEVPLALQPLAPVGAA